MILELIDEAVEAGARQFKACEVVGLSERTIQRWRRQGGGGDQRRGPNTTPRQALSEQERQTVLETVNNAENRDVSPKQIVPLLSAKGEYIGSESSIYRILRAAKQMAHRQRSRPALRRTKPRLVAYGPNDVWTWDITYLRSPVRGEFYYLYLALDLWSRKIVAWRVEERESEELSSEMIQQACEILGIDIDQLTLHADNGGPMKGATMLATLDRLGVTASFSRPRVSNDNPFSEALFRTVKYRPDYPNGPFKSIEDARAWVAAFVTWYNTVHQHSAIRYVTPEDRYTGREHDVLARRRRTYEQARRRNPSRWSGPTRNWNPVGAVYLNPDTDELTYAEVA